MFHCKIPSLIQWKFVLIILTYIFNWIDWRKKNLSFSCNWVDFFGKCLKYWYRHSLVGRAFNYTKMAYEFRELFFFFLINARNVDQKEAKHTESLLKFQRSMLNRWIGVRAGHCTMSSLAKCMGFRRLLWLWLGHVINYFCRSLRDEKEEENILYLLSRWNVPNYGGLLN